MNTCEMRFPGFDAASERGPIRWSLFLHHEVRDVLLTPRADTLAVVYRGPARPEAWAATLREDGFPEPVFGGSALSPGEDRVQASPSRQSA